MIRYIQILDRESPLPVLRQLGLLANKDDQRVRRCRLREMTPPASSNADDRYGGRNIGYIMSN
jgi:hypothetical protein